MTEARCTICKNVFTDSDARPFCGKRCRLIDLGNWLGGRYAIPGEENRDEQSAEISDEDSTNR